MPKIGVKLRELRRRRDLGVRELAARSGISHSTISLIERDRMSPSIDTLSAVLDALGTTLPGFFSDLQSSLPYTPFYTSQDLVEIGKVDTISYRVIGLDHPNRQLLMLHERYAVGADSGEAFTHAAQEAGMLLSGAVEVTVGGQQKILRPGDGYYFDSRLPHRFRNVHDGESEILSAITPPTY
ncbi:MULTISPECIES: cupin domain-containing protein [unclassified Rhizobium]|jgi:transcriptional regulator with XRE-family HTH domain|uniref:cupin domain-containing protein n=1 Tax=unclassified Rhizobium TaxID=2613769 RepID=UPI0003742061|nr:MULTISPECIES: cupin domain-containing protein [unclassified Rhizobium]MBD9447318.1 cupin domain-containing protein [Rhizobium sp. RHZ01]MBD9450388.1 cupin domain-containing protein [Rhizobium sp. RHZ02]